MLHSLHVLPVEIMLFLTLLLGAIFVLFAFWKFGEVGVQLYLAIAIIAANLQVLTACTVVGYADPIPQGTAVFTTTFLANNLLTEFYGSASARKAVWLGFFATLMLSCFMQITIATRPAEILSGSADAHFMEAYQAIVTLFSPSLAIFFASMLAYFISQYTDIWVFQWVKHRTKGRFLWLRSLLANMTSAWVDNSVFSLLLIFFVFDVATLSFMEVVSRYIFGTYLLRVLAALCNLPVLYGARWIVQYRAK